MHPFPLPSRPLAAVIALLMGLASCSGGGGGGGGSNPAAGIRITLSPAAPSVMPDSSMLFSALVTGTSDRDATWAVLSGTATGSIAGGPSPTATFRAGSAVGTCQVKATSVADPTQSATVTVTVITPGSVIPTHPRLLLDADSRTRPLRKRDTNDPSWVALKDRADALATYAVLPYTYATSSQAGANTIYYTYQGEGWLEAALPLGFAYQKTGDTR